MDKAQVAVVFCDSYDQEKVNEAVSRGLNLIGGIDKFVSKDEKILIKPNFLTAKKPEAAVSPHPSIFKALINELQNNKITQLYFGDSPGFGSSKNAAKMSGFQDVADELGVKRLEFDHGKDIPFSEGIMAKSYALADGVIQTDALISLSKMKSHALTRITGALKNQFGVIYGMNKAAYHSLYPNMNDFSKALIDINKLVKPRLYIMDGVVAMEGNGPKNGEPLSMNVLLFSDNPVALDTVFARLVDLNPEYVPTIKNAHEVGFKDFDEIEILGDPIEPLINKDFKVERLPVKDETPGGIGKLKYLKNLLTRRPVVDKSKCIKCGICEKHCPQNPKAVEVKEDGAKYNYSRCIRCFCCQELCPNNAITVQTPWLGKLLLYR